MHFPDALRSFRMTNAVDHINTRVLFPLAPTLDAISIERGLMSLKSTVGVGYVCHLGLLVRMAWRLCIGTGFDAHVRGDNSKSQFYSIGMWFVADLVGWSQRE